MGNARLGQEIERVWSCLLGFGGVYAAAACGDAIVPHARGMYGLFACYYR